MLFPGGPRNRVSAGSKRSSCGNVVLDIAVSHGQMRTLAAEVYRVCTEGAALFGLIDGQATKDSISRREACSISEKPPQVYTGRLSTSSKEAS